MKVTDLEGNVSTWKMKGSVVISKGRECSALHIKARKLVHEVYPTVTLLEEVPLHVRPSNVLYLDFYIPLHKIAIEVHGKQHYEYIRHFHRDRIACAKHMRRDREKAEWCELNDIKLIVLPYNETVDEWRQKINM